MYRLPYYEACVRDTCGCDTSGDCECMCDAVAAYAKACLDKGVCVDWRTPDFCRECPAAVCKAAWMQCSPWAGPGASSTPRLPVQAP